MEKVSAELMESIDWYIESMFAPDDAALQECLRASEEAGLPAIQVSPNQGKLLYLIAKMARAQRILEIGTLGGYSAIWLARALPADGTLVTIEREAKHADLARSSLAKAGLSGRTEILVGPAANVMRQLIGEGAPPFDLIFIDADKPGYVEYLELALRLSKDGTVVLADNVIRHGEVLQENPADANAAAVRRFNAALAAETRLESVLLPIVRSRVDGLSVSVVKHQAAGN